MGMRASKQKSSTGAAFGAFLVCQVRRMAICELRNKGAGLTGDGRYSYFVSVRSAA